MPPPHVFTDLEPPVVQQATVSVAPAWNIALKNASIHLGLYSLALLSSHPPQGPKAPRNGDRCCRGVFLTFPSYVACLEHRLWSGTRQQVYMNLQCPEDPAQPKVAFSLVLAGSSSFRMFRDPTLCEHKARKLQLNDVDTSFDNVTSTFRASRRGQTSSVPLAVTAIGSSPLAALVPVPLSPLWHRNLMKSGVMYSLVVMPDILEIHNNGSRPFPSTFACPASSSSLLEFLASRVPFIVVV
ncbi:hypothetical protein EV421DRAFT_1730924 [Armillaria borealis]|uniref:Uncharacterized protein n=1 Tax=Armillaria borealis TaxID=47425 RepID=A0AA39MZT6_9AGAR|nr:hypothetical protein EV421DRAFT_1730924 [Armillaria borealis]